MTVVMTEAAPAHDYYENEAIAQERSFHIHNFTKRLQRLFSIIRFTMMYRLGMS